MLSAPALAALSCIITKMCRAKCESPLKTLSNVKTFVPFATLALKVKNPDALQSCTGSLGLCKTNFYASDATGNKFLVKY